MSSVKPLSGWFLMFASLLVVSGHQTENENCLVLSAIQRLLAGSKTQAREQLERGCPADVLASASVIASCFFQLHAWLARANFCLASSGCVHFGQLSEVTLPSARSGRSRRPGARSSQRLSHKSPDEKPHIDFHGASHFSLLISWPLAFFGGKTKF